MPQGSLWQLAFSGVVALILFLAYGSQLIIPKLEPYSLDRNQIIIFNSLVACVWVTYIRACFTNPGSVPSDWSSCTASASSSSQKQSWCRKCKVYKPPRAHHCKVCQRCIPKMDHHCPWTINCVSHRTLPHFMRFLFYAVVAMAYLEYFLFVRAATVWSGRHLPMVCGILTSWQLQLTAGT